MAALVSNLMIHVLTKISHSFEKSSLLFLSVKQQ